MKFGGPLKEREGRAEDNRLSLPPSYPFWAELFPFHMKFAPMGASTEKDYNRALPPLGNSCIGPPL